MARKTAVQKSTHVEIRTAKNRELENRFSDLQQDKPLVRGQITQYL
jgi:hypothetical protein